MDLYEIPLLAGSNLTPTSTAKDAVVNETLVRELGFTNEEIIGMEFFQTGRDTTRIVGVMGDFHFRDFSLKIEATEMKRFNWGPPEYLSVKIVESDIQSVLDHIKTTLASISEKYPFEYTFYDDVYAKTFISEAKTSRLMTIFAGVAIAIAALGLYGLILHMVNQRMKEIGIRKTLGAGSLSIIKLLSGKFGSLILTGYVIACGVGYYGIQRWLEGFAYKISPAVVDFAITLLAIVLIAGLAVSSRIAIALRVNPASVLKQEG
jgi:putative ABC transport system permease protein